MNPEKIHSGSWYLMLLQASEVANRDDEIAMLRQIDRVARRYLCLECRNHFQEYVRNHSPHYYCRGTNRWKSLDEREIEVVLGHAIGLFVYLWEAKNAVNRRLGVPQLDLKTAFALYSPYNTPCTTCGH